MATMPRETVLEFYLNGWTQIDARQSRPITITRGRLDWSGATSPSRFAALLGDEEGDLNPDNPVGAHYGRLTRNTPMRYRYVLLRDTFNRTVVDGFGSTTPDTVIGHTTLSLPYTLDGTPADFDVGGATATIVIAAASTARHAYLATYTTLTDPHILLDITVPSGTGGDCTGGLIFRGSTLSDFWRLTLTVTTGGLVTLGIFDAAGTARGGSYTVDTATAGAYRLALGVDSKTIYGKAWPPAQPEPYGWQVSYNVDEDGAAFNTSGWFGIRVRTGTGATNATFTLDNLVVSSMRYFGVTRKLAPDKVDRDKRVALEGAGVLRLIERNAPLLSSLRQGLLRSATPPFGYWPMEDGKDATAFAPAIGTTSIEPLLGSPKTATNDDFVCSDRLPLLNKSVLQLVIPAYSNPNNSLQTRFLLSVPDAGDTPDGAIILRLFTTGTAAFWDIVYYTAGTGSLGLNAYDQAGSTILSIGATLDTNNGRPERVLLNLVQNGANIDWGLFVGPVPTDIDSGSAFGTSGTVNSHTFSLTHAIWIGTSGGLADTAVGHLSLHDSITPVLDLRNALGAYTGERAGRRVERLCSQNNLSFSFLGDLDETAKMGPQRPGKLIDAFRECEVADGAALLEPRLGPGIYFRAGSTLLGQASGATLDYSAGQLAGRFEVDHDDQNIANRVTVRRTHGGDYVATQTSGPLNVNDPGVDPDGVGVYDSPVTVNVHAEGQLTGIGDWLLHLGTTTEPRVPELSVNAASRNITTALDTSLLSVDVDDRVRVQNLTGLDRYEPLDLLVRGVTETLDTVFSHSLSVVAAPETPYHVIVLDDATSARLDSDTTTLAEDLTTTETGADVTVTGALWTTLGADFPFDVMVSPRQGLTGERMTVTAITGSASPQTMTVTRGVNGVITTHATGAVVRLADPHYLA